MSQPSEQPTAPVSAPKPRYDSLDIARGIGIVLVIYGHFIQSFFQPDAPAIFAQYQFIYAFHMPLFFILSGMAGQLGTPTLRKTIRGALELVLLAALVHLVGTGIDLLTRPQGTGWSTPEIFRNGFATGNASVGVMWFLLCLGMIRLTVGSALLLRNSLLRGAAIVALLVLFAAAYARRGDWPLWQDTTLLFGALFFLAGRYLPLRWLPRLSQPLLLPLSLAVTAACAFLNRGCGFSFAPDGPHCGGPVYNGLHPVIMMMGEYNNYLLFGLGALSGTLLCLQLAQLLLRAGERVSQPWLSIGRDTLGLLILNAFYCAFLLPAVAAHMPPDGLDSVTLTAAACGLTLLHLFAYRALKPATDTLIALANACASLVAR